eukprot:TRINITY_DN2502_c1_g1_i2.p1 TRINITY_DN2502_c1_g1~~TRINITY_DN2502_c1_g1_i2.p1  ORF type:complete len:454 (+),score=79.77 TRINITY_DN2502_c1_g1_i2:196-1557(+)
MATKSMMLAQGLRLEGGAAGSLSDSIAQKKQASSLISCSIQRHSVKSSESFRNQWLPHAVKQRGWGLTKTQTPLSLPSPPRMPSQNLHTGCAKGLGAGLPSTATSLKDMESDLDADRLVLLQAFIREGPLITKVGLASEVKGKIREWAHLGQLLARQLGFDYSQMTPSQKKRIYHYYLPTFWWCMKQLDEFRAGKAAAAGQQRGSPPALVIGISAPQGCGKTTLVASLEYLFNSLGRRAAAVSIDDFYLTAAGQTALAEENAGNPLLELRGNAGSHDLDLGSRTLSALRNLGTPGAKLKLPRYEKSARMGRGDRADPSKWPEVEGPVQVVLFEGWMLGFQPVASESATAIDPHLEEVNKRLAKYKLWDDEVDTWVVIQVGDPTWVYDWRLQAEVEMRASGRTGMTDEQVADFVSRYIPAYKAYLPGLYSKGPTTGRPGHVLQLEIDQKRNPVG